jgi:hypothetical protein
MECHRLRREVAALQRMLIDSGVELGSLVRRETARAGDLFQPLLPF